MGDKAELSVVIACYNAGATVGEQLEALARQRGGVCFEVLVCDNGSTDDSREVAASFADRLDLRVIDASQAQGPGYARNRGVEEARAELVAFCDADDVVADDWVATMTEALRRDAFVAGRVDVHRLNDVATNARAVRSRAMRQEEGLQTSGTAGNLPHAGAGNMGVVRDVFRGVGGFDNTFRALEDSDLCWRIQLAGTPLVFHPEVLLYTRMRSTWRSMMSQAFLYGRSFAQVEKRYGDAPKSPGAGSQAPPARGPIGQLVDNVRARGVGGGVWHLTWHAGHWWGQRRPLDSVGVASAPGGVRGV